ncbi:MAG: tRNA (adenosine(37)-N6)-threonylcarbamoyltransferase complex ATPase subunit type 1 TsaE [Candidatus Dormibacteria bacterium]
MSLRTRSEEDTREIGRRIGEALRPGDCLALRGPMGAGKTVTAQGIVAGAGGGQDVRSPTFLLHSVYPGRVTVHHLDLFRLEPGVDLRTLGIDEALGDGAVVVEWPDRADRTWFNGEVELAIVSRSERELRLTLPAGLAGDL